MNVLLDLDGVCAASLKPAVKRVCERLGLEPFDPQPNGYHTLEEMFPEEHRAEARDLIRGIYQDSEVYLEAEVIPGAVELAQHLAGQRRLWGYLTRRPHSVNLASRQWLLQHDFPLRGMGGMPVLHATDETPKSRWMQVTEVSLLVEDSPKEALEVLENAPHARVIMPTYTYNRDCTHERLIRVASVQAAYEMLSLEGGVEAYGR